MDRDTKTLLWIILDFCESNWSALESHVEDMGLEGDIEEIFEKLKKEAQ